MIIDRSLSEMQAVAESLFVGAATSKMIMAFANGWRCLNPQNFIQSNHCYKILM